MGCPDLVLVGVDLSADVHHRRAPGVKGATRRWMEQIGRCSFHLEELGAIQVDVGYGPEKTLGVWVLGVGKHLVHISQLD